MNARRKELDNAIEKRFSHAGLILTRYLQAPVKDGDFDTARLDIIGQAADACGHAYFLYNLAYDKRLARLAAIGARCFTAEIASRLAVGLGTASPIEVGLRLHHLYGVPIIPGSALKGVALRAWKAIAESQKIEKEEECQRILFGDTDSAGFIAFHDAWSESKKLQERLSGDIMTPHHQDYYGQKASAESGHIGPTDFDDPVPIPFVSVNGRMHFALSCLDKSDQGEKWLDWAEYVLKYALEHLGVGAKTTSGYGRFHDFKP